jgi:DNA-binding CsgD family transcriptional regulator
VEPFQGVYLYLVDHADALTEAVGDRPGGGRVFVGRGREKGLLQRAWEDAQAGRPRVVLLRGPAGIGKSALVRELVDSVGPVQLLRASGDETEEGLSLGVVEQLVAGLASVPEVLPSLQRPSGALELFAVGSGLLELLSELQDQGPVLLVLDDAHWADSASLHALAFCLRRLRVDRVLAVVVARSEGAARLPAALLRLVAGNEGLDLELSGLAASEVSELSNVLGAGRMPTRLADRLARDTQGNPLLVAALLADGSVHGTATTGYAPGAPTSFANVVRARLATTSTATGELAGAASVLGVRWPLAFAAGVAQLAEPLPAVDGAVEAGLIVVDHEATGLVGAFTHPLVRSTVYGDLSLTRRSVLHRRAARLAADPRDVLRHRIEAASGPDEDLYAEALALAARDAADGSMSSAASAYLWAARVAPGHREQERHVLDAVVAMLFADDIAEAGALLGTTRDFEDGARLRFAHGYRAWTQGDIATASRELLASWQWSQEEGDPLTAARSAELLANLSVYLGRGADGIDWARKALDQRAEPDSASNPLTSMILGYAMSRPLSEGLALAEQLMVSSETSADGVVGLGTARLWADDPRGARRDLLQVAEHCLRRGPLERGMFAAVHLADAEWRLGQWDDALLHGRAAVGAAEDAFHVWFLPEAHAVTSFPLAARGEWEAAAEHVTAAVAAAKHVGYGHGTLWALVARARLADARGDHEGVLRALTPLLTFTEVDGVDHPGLHPWRDLLGAALVALGRPEEALPHAETLDRQARDLDVPVAAGRALRLRGLVETATGRHADAVATLTAALKVFARDVRPFDWALVSADLGAALRREGERVSAGSHLDGSRTALLALGAHGFLPRVERELAACGRRTGVASSGATLTPAEQAVAHLVAQGKTNREVASELVNSVKTVEHHLGRIFEKLGVRSRTELTLLLRGVS